MTDSPEVEPEEVDSYDDSLDQTDSSDSAASMSDDLMAEGYPSLDTPPVESMPVDFEPVDYSSDDAEAEVSPSVMVAGKVGASAQRKRLKKDSIITEDSWSIAKPVGLNVAPSAATQIRAAATTEPKAEAEMWSHRDTVLYLLSAAIGVVGWRRFGC